MAKTVFGQGTYILANWLNAIFGGGAHKVWAANQAYAAGVVIKLSGGEILRCIIAGTSHASTEPTAPGSLRGTVVDNTVTWELFGGHLHDGKDMDGSAPKVLLTEIDGVSEGTFDMVFPDTQFTAEKTANCYWKKESPTYTGGPSTVFLHIKAMQGTSNSTGLQPNGTPIPEAIRPRSGTRVYPHVVVIDNTTYEAYDAIMFIDSSGATTFNKAGAFTASGKKGFDDLLVVYSVWS